MNKFFKIQLDNFPLTLTIKKVDSVSINRKIYDVLSFEGTPKSLVLNQSNIRILTELFGDWDNLPGKEITLNAVQVEFNGKEVPGIRISAAKTGE